MNFDLYFIAYTKINSRWTTNLNVKGKTIKLVEENRRSLGPWATLKKFNRTQKALIIKENFDKSDYIKTMNILVLDFPGGLVVRIPAFHCGGPGSIPGQGRSCKPRSVAKNK